MSRIVRPTVAKLRWLCLRYMNVSSRCTGGLITLYVRLATRFRRGHERRLLRRLRANRSDPNDNYSRVKGCLVDPLDLWPAAAAPPLIEARALIPARET